eukprot:6033385-Karenia_brevis.AAC.1
MLLQRVEADRVECADFAQNKVLIVGGDFNNMPKDEDAIALGGPAKPLPRARSACDAEERD